MAGERGLFREIETAQEQGKDPMDVLFLVLDALDKLSKKDYAEELERIRNKEKSDYAKTIYVYDEKDIPEGYVKQEGVMRSTFMLRKHSRRVYRNTGKKVYVIPHVEQTMDAEFPVYVIYTTPPKPTTPITPITRGVPIEKEPTSEARVPSTPPHQV